MSIGKICCCLNNVRTATVMQQKYSFCNRSNQMGKGVYDEELIQNQI